MKKLHPLLRGYIVFLFGFLVTLGVCAHQGILLFGETPTSDNDEGNNRNRTRSYHRYYHHK